jgi:hypothetical protein
MAARGARASRAGPPDHALLEGIGLLAKADRVHESLIIPRDLDNGHVSSS